MDKPLDAVAPIIDICGWPLRVQLEQWNTQTTLWLEQASVFYLSTWFKPLKVFPLISKQLIYNLDGQCK